jgi:hypothetical protein
MDKIRRKIRSTEDKGIMNNKVCIRSKRWYGIDKIRKKRMRLNGYNQMDSNIHSNTVVMNKMGIRHFGSL